MPRHPGSVPILVLCLVLLPGSVAFAGQKEEVPLKGLSRRNDVSGLPEKLARMTFVHAGTLSPKEFVQSHHCVVGTWEYRSETKTHWVGVLHYPSNNHQKDSITFLADARIRKSGDVKVDMTTWKGRLLLQAKPSKPVAGQKKPPTPEMLVIGYDKAGLRDGIVDLHEALPYAPPK